MEASAVSCCGVAVGWHVLSLFSSWDFRWRSRSFHLHTTVGRCGKSIVPDSRSFIIRETVLLAVPWPYQAQSAPGSA